MGNNPNILQLRNGQTVVHLHNGIPLSNKKEHSTDTCNNMNRSQMYYAKCEKLESEGHTLYDSISVTFWRRQNFIGTESRSVVAGCWAWGKGLEGTQRNF